MHAGHALDLADLLDELDANLLAFELLVLGPFQALDHRIGHMDARHVGAHPARAARRGQRPDADQDEAFFVQAQLAHLRHEPFQQRHVVAVLGLDELRAGGDLLGQMQRPVVIGRREGVGGSTQEDLGRHW